METKELTPQLSVAAQIRASDLQTFAQQGFKTIINNRPDKEVQDQPLSADLAIEASRLGLVFIEVPVNASGVTDQNVLDFGKQLAAAVAPVLAFCRTGTRSTILWALHTAMTRDVEFVMDTAKRAGYDLSTCKARLEAATES